MMFKRNSDVVKGGYGENKLGGVHKRGISFACVSRHILRSKCVTS
jgi:hypothetical protein